MAMDRACVEETSQQHHQSSSHRTGRGNPVCQRPLGEGLLKRKDHKLTWGELERNAHDREKWRSLVLALRARGYNKD